MALFTAGYAGFSPEGLARRLLAEGIAWVVDVRSHPYSARFPAFSQEALQRFLQGRGLGYLHLGREFGARQRDPAWLLPGGYLDFARYVQSASFLAGCRRIACGLAKGLGIVLLCAEKEPRDCHRGVMLGRWFASHGTQVVHLLPEGAKTQRDVDAELLALHCRGEFGLQGGRLVDRKAMLRAMPGMPSVADRLAFACRQQNLAGHRDFWRAGKIVLAMGQGLAYIPSVHGMWLSLVRVQRSGR